MGEREREEMIIHDKVICEWEVNPYCGYHPSDGIDWRMTNEELLSEYIKLADMELDYETEVYAWRRQKYIVREAKRRGYDIKSDVMKHYEEEEREV